MRGVVVVGLLIAWLFCWMAGGQGAEGRQGDEDYVDQGPT